MTNPDPDDPDRYLALPEAFNVLGRERFGAVWTGSELEARVLPPPDETFAAIERAEATIDRIEAGRKQKAEALRHPTQGAVAPKTIPAVEAPPHENPSSRFETIAHFAGVAPDVVAAATDETAYREEYAARQRRNQIEQELRGALYAERREAVVLNTEDGLVISIPNNNWAATDLYVEVGFHVDFGKGVAGWIENKDGQYVAYAGTVWIERLDATGEIARSDRAGVANGAEPTAVLAEDETKPTTLAPPVDDGEPSAVAQSSKWWPKKPETQDNWRRLWARAKEFEPEPEKWKVSFIATKFAKEDLQVRIVTDEAEKRFHIIRKALYKMRKEDGPPKQ